MNRNTTLRVGMAIFLGTLVLGVSPPNTSGQSLIDQLIGDWKVDMELTKQLFADRNITNPTALETLTGAKLKFQSSRTFVLAMSKSKASGKWSVEKADDQSKQLTITMYMDGGPTVGGSFQFLDDGSIIMHPANSAPAVFVPDKKSAEMDLKKIKAKLVAMWAGHADSTKTVNEKLGIEAAQIETAVTQVARMRLRIHKDGSYAMTITSDDGDPQEINGTWELGKPNAAGNKVEFKATTESQELLFMIWFENDDTLVFHGKDQPASVFKRNKPHDW